MKKICTFFVALLFVAGCFAETITVAQAIAIGQALEHNVPTSETYTIEGYVNAIAENSFNTSYNNMSVWIADTRGTASSTANGAFECYRCRPDRELELGDKIRVVSTIKKWNSTVETAQINAPMYWLESQPEPATGSLRVCAQNLSNYYYNYDLSDRPSYSDAAGFREKTLKIVNAMLSIDADIYAFCEVEAKPIVLQQLADSMNAHAGASGRYAAVSDGIDYTWYEGISDNQIKSGFIYRTDRVKTYGSNTGATSGNGYYAHTMRLQTFEQKANGERLVISMNHFKAKDSSSDAGESQRVTNANNLVNALKKVTVDPDILVLGDLNCQVGEAPLTILANAGYEEQLLKYDANAWSHCYNTGELIDHVYANSSMAAQIVNAYVKHICAYKCNSSVTKAQSWSDHDPYIVEIDLNSDIPAGPCVDIDETWLTSTLEPLTSVNNIWYWNSGGYAKASKQGGATDYMLTPEMNLSEMSSASLSFQHTHKYAGTPSEELTLWVTPDYQGDVSSSEWHQLTINPYAANTNWTFVDVTVSVPDAYLGKHTVFAFKYMSTTANYATWEIKNLHVKAKCAGSTDIENIDEPKETYKIIRQGQLIIIRSGIEYTITGQRVR